MSTLVTGFDRTAMSGYAPAPHKPDSRIFASYPMPAKIDLINEKPRRESLVEQQLANKINSGSHGSELPKIEITERSFTSTQNYSGVPETGINTQNFNESRNVYHHQTVTNSFSNHPTGQQLIGQQAQSAGQQINNQQIYNPTYGTSNQAQQNTRTITSNATLAKTIANNKAVLAAELADKEAKLMAEITALHQRPYSPFQMPSKIDLTNDQRANLQQQENAPSPRPYSRASSTKSTSADLMDKEAKLLQEIEEMEKKPYNPQRMVVEREQWYEYPEGRPNDRHLTDSKRRVKDFCSLPSHMYNNRGTHIHEENLPISTLGHNSAHGGSIHTTIIRSPKREIDNKSPLPFAFDNFSTKGVRGNIASVGAIEPDRPRPPIYPIIKRTPSPNMAR